MVCPAISAVVNISLLHAETNKGTYSFVLPVSGDWQKGKAVVTDVMTGVTAAVQF